MGTLPTSDLLGAAASDGAAATDVLALLRARGLVAQLTHPELLAAHLAQGPCTFYIGYDPTGPSLHAGHLVTLVAARHLAAFGHRPILLVGGATARVGDPHGKTEARPQLGAEAIAANAAALRGQMARIVGAGAAPQVCDNAEWLGGLKALDFLSDTGRHFPVSRMLSAETYKARLNTGLTFFEFSYQLLQAYDFSELNRRHGCRLQVGGDDQWSNILGGVELCRRRGQPQAFGLTVPLIATANGAKMGKTLGGAIWLDAEATSPAEFYQYWVNTPDSDLLRFLRLLTDLPLADIEAVANAWSPAALNAAKNVLAWEVTSLVHGRDVADAAHQAALGAFGARILPAQLLPSSSVPRASAADAHAVPAHEVQPGDSLLSVLLALGWAKSNNEARRLVAQGGVSLDGQKLQDAAFEFNAAAKLAGAAWLLRAGKKRVVRLVPSISEAKA